MEKTNEFSNPENTENDAPVRECGAAKKMSLEELDKFLGAKCLNELRVRIYDFCDGKIQFYAFENGFAMKNISLTCNRDYAINLIAKTIHNYMLDSFIGSLGEKHFTCSLTALTGFTIPTPKRWDELKPENNNDRAVIEFRRIEAKVVLDNFIVMERETNCPAWGDEEESEEF